LFCVCPHDHVTCEDICIPEECYPFCTDSCDGMAEGASCCGNGALTCQTEGGTGGPKRCLPPL
jgi:hypothetical protein